ncbi:T9SS-dependent choice-of-anchor J family protein [Hwangdonia lutea]|uniref:T9SS type A sorting domain-containing protein n=1 Tax=Hwangdonia lutea TaxID=3075823 RepID=A0AA97HQY3_9FLAO|nr:T9SS type A sorting domain-containing protein [Hwangdonia sp. SCSIO 19198]WOD42873.1 T9SS type A sorting domain-containing protein [Hwangdonia sp. SCSIO 19198]
MKKITQKLFFLIFGLLAFSISAQTIYYEDFRYENESRGFTVQKVALGGQAANQVGKRVNDVVDALDSSPVFDESSRPTNRIPAGAARDQRTIAFTNTSGSPADTNYEIEAWALMTNQDLSSANAPKVSFWTQQRYVFGGGATLTVWVSENYTHGNAPNTATWTDETSNIIGSIATSDVSPQTYVKGELDLSSYTGSSVTIAFKMVTDNSAFNAGVSQHGTFYISDVKFEATPQDVADGAFSALNTSSSGQTNIFNTPSASISDSNFSNTTKWADVLTTATSVPRLANGVLIPIGEGYKFEVSSAYNPIAVTEVRYILANGTSNKGAPDESKWVVQGSNDDTNWDDLCSPVGMFSGNSGAGSEYPITLSTTQAYRYYRFVLSTAWTPNSAYTALQQLDFTVDSSVVLSTKDNVLDQAFSIYPNPARETLNISRLDSSINIKSTKLLDITGKVVYKTDVAKSIDVSQFSPGLYLLKLESKEGGVLTKKIILK